MSSRIDPCFTIDVIAFKGKGKTPAVYHRSFVGRGTIKSAALKLFGIPDTLDYDRLAIHVANEQTPVRVTDAVAERVVNLIDCSPKAKGE